MNPTQCNYPPQGFQLATGAGVLTGAQIPTPAGINFQAGVPFVGSQGTASPMAFKVFDTANGNTSGNPICSVSTPNVYPPVILDVPFVNGLYVVQTTPGSINFSFA